MPRAHPRTAGQRWFQQIYETTPYREMHWFTARPHPYLVQANRAGWLGQRSRVLDVGCGAGTSALYLARRGFRVSAIDFAPGAVKVGNQRAVRAGLSIDFRVAEATELPYGDGQFEGVVDEGCFHSIPVAKRRRYAQEMARVLRPKGHLLLAWAGRESTAVPKGPHLLSLAQVTNVLEDEFLFKRTEFADREWGPLSMYHAVLERRVQ